MADEQKQVLQDSQVLLIEANGLVEQARYLLNITERKLPQRADWLESTAHQLREDACKLIADHGELLNRRESPVDIYAQAYWRHATEQVVNAREMVSKAWVAATSYAVELRYPPGPKGWWYALLRGLGLRKGIDRKSLDGQT